MKKKRLITVSLVLIILFLIYGYIYCNLKVNSVYYAKHTPHKKGTEPVLMMLVDNLDWIYNPDVDGIEYDFDGKAAIKMYNANKNQIGFLTSSYKDGKKGYLFDDENSATVVEFDSRFNTTKMYDTSEAVQERDFTKYEAKNIKISYTKY